VIEQTFGVLGSSGATIWPLAAIFVLTPQVLMAFAQANASQAALSGAEAASQTAFVLYFILVVVASLVGLVFQTSVIFCVIEGLNGRPASLATCLLSGLKLAIPAFAIGILVGLGVGLGLLLLIVPGLMLLVRWSVAVPVRVAEGPGINSALSRSATLTRHNRWAIFGAYLILWVAFLVLTMVLVAVTALLPHNGDPASATRGAPYILLSAALVTVLTTFSAAGTAIIYTELRNVREGGDPERVAAVFA
jgi:hypothetical protein